MKPNAANFDVWFTPIGRADYHELRADVKREVDEAVAALQRSGCAAAHYRLAGTAADVGHVCVVHLARDWRMILGFPAPHEVTVLLVGRHLRGARSIYHRLYRLLDVTDPTEERDKPPCCEEGDPPLDARLVERVVANARRLRRA